MQSCRLKQKSRFVRNRQHTGAVSGATLGRSPGRLGKPPPPLCTVAENRSPPGWREACHQETLSEVSSLGPGAGVRMGGCFHLRVQVHLGRLT